MFLLIKGSRWDAHRAAARYGLSITVDSERSTETTTAAFTKSTDVRIWNWLGEDVKCEPQVYPPGSLLWFTPDYAQ